MSDTLDPQFPLAARGRVITPTVPPPPGDVAVEVTGLALPRPILPCGTCGTPLFFSREGRRYNGPLWVQCGCSPEGRRGE